jgi:hypothetical protein
MPQEHFLIWIKRNFRLRVLLLGMLLAALPLKAQLLEDYASHPGAYVTALQNSGVDTVFRFYGGDSSWRFVDVPLRYHAYHGADYVFWIKNGVTYIRKYFSFQKMDAAGTAVPLESPAVSLDTSEVFPFIFLNRLLKETPPFGQYFYWAGRDSSSFVSHLWQSHPDEARLEILCGAQYSTTHFQHLWMEPYSTYEFYDSLRKQNRIDTCCHNLNYAANMNNPWKQLFDKAWREIARLESQQRLPLLPVESVPVRKRRKK